MAYLRLRATEYAICDGNFWQGCIDVVFCRTTYPYHYAECVSNPSDSPFHAHGQSCLPSLSLFRIRTSSSAFRYRFLIRLLILMKEFPCGTPGHSAMKGAPVVMHYLYRQLFSVSQATKRSWNADWLILWAAKIISIVIVLLMAVISVMLSIEEETLLVPLVNGVSKALPVTGTGMERETASI